MNSPSAGNMLRDAVGKLFATVLKILALILASFFEIVGKLFFWISEVIKRNAK
jgi:hypothetical protein